MDKPSKHLEKFRKTQMLDGESLIDSTRAFRKDTAFEGIAILTDKRLCFFRAGALSDKFEPFPLSRVSSVEARKGLLLFEMKIHTSGDDIVLTLVEGADAGAQFVRKVQQALIGGVEAAPVPAVSAPQSDDPMAQLEKLGALRAAGVVSEEEFAAKKAELLARI